MDALDALVAPLVAPAGGQYQDTSSQPQGDPLDALVQPTKKGLPPPTENPVDIQSLVNKTKNPEETKKKLSLAKNAAPILGMSEYDIFRNAEIVSKKLYGPFENPGSSSSKLETYLKNTALDQQINRIHGLHPLGALPAEDQKKVDELEKQKSGNTLQGIPKFAADVITGIGTFAQGIGQKIDYGAENLSENMQGIIATTLPVLGVQMNPDTAEYHFNMAAKAAQEFTAVGIGAAKRAGRERGEGEVSSLITAEILDLGNTAMLAFPAGRAKDAMEVAFANVVAKSGLKGGLLKAGEAAVKQTTFAATAAAWNNMVEQFGTELSNVAEKTNIPLKTLQQQAQDIGISTVQMAAGGLLTEGAASMLGKLRGIAERTDKANAKPLSGEAGGVAKAPGAPKADQFIDEAAKDRQRASAAKATVAKLPAAELDTPIPFEDVPRGTSKPNVPELEGAVKQLQGEIEHAKLVNPDSVPSREAELAKYQFALDAAKAEGPKEVPPVTDPLDKQVAEDRRVVAAKEQAPALQKAINEEMAKPEPDQARVKALQNIREDLWLMMQEYLKKFFKNNLIIKNLVL